MITPLASQVSVAPTVAPEPAEQQPAAPTQAQKNKDALFRSLPRLGGVATSIFVGMGGLGKLIRRFGLVGQVGLVRPMMLGTIVGGAVEFGLLMLERQRDDSVYAKHSWLDLAKLAFWDDAFSATLNLAIGRTVGLGLGNVHSIVRGMLVNLSIGEVQAFKNQDTTHGSEDRIIAMISGALGGAWAPWLQQRAKTELAFEISREFFEGLAQIKFDRHAPGELTTDVMIESLVMSFSEVGGSLAGHRGGVRQSQQQDSTETVFLDLGDPFVEYKRASATLARVDRWYAAYQEALEAKRVRFSPNDPTPASLDFESLASPNVENKEYAQASQESLQSGVIIEPGRVTLYGKVYDQQAADKLMDDYLQGRIDELFTGPAPTSARKVLIANAILQKHFRVFVKAGLYGPSQVQPLVDACLKAGKFKGFNHLFKQHLGWMVQQKVFEERHFKWVLEQLDLSHRAEAASEFLVARKAALEQCPGWYEGAEAKIREEAYQSPEKFRVLEALAQKLYEYRPGLVKTVCSEALCALIKAKPGMHLSIGRYLTDHFAELDPQSDIACDIVKLATRCLNDHFGNKAIGMGRWAKSFVTENAEVLRARDDFDYPAAHERMMGELTGIDPEVDYTDHDNGVRRVMYYLSREADHLLSQGLLTEEHVKQVAQYIRPSTPLSAKDSRRLGRDASPRDYVAVLSKASVTSAFQIESRAWALNFLYRRFEKLAANGLVDRAVIEDWLAGMEVFRDFKKDDDIQFAMLRQTVQFAAEQTPKLLAAGLLHPGDLPKVSRVVGKMAYESMPDFLARFDQLVSAGVVNADTVAGYREQARTKQNFTFKGMDLWMDEPKAVLSFENWWQLRRFYQKVSRIYESTHVPFSKWDGKLRHEDTVLLDYIVKQETASDFRHDLRLQLGEDQQVTKPEDSPDSKITLAEFLDGVESSAQAAAMVTSQRIRTVASQAFLEDISQDATKGEAARLEALSQTQMWQEFCATPLFRYCLQIKSASNVEARQVYRHFVLGLERDAEKGFRYPRYAKLKGALSDAFWKRWIQEYQDGDVVVTGDVNAMALIQKIKVARERMDIAKVNHHGVCINELMHGQYKWAYVRRDGQIQAACRLKVSLDHEGREQLSIDLVGSEAHQDMRETIERYATEVLGLSLSQVYYRKEPPSQLLQTNFKTAKKLRRNGFEADEAEVFSRASLEEAHGIVSAVYNRADDWRMGDDAVLQKYGVDVVRVRLTDLPDNPGILQQPGHSLSEFWQQRGYAVRASFLEWKRPVPASHDDFLNEFSSDRKNSLVRNFKKSQDFNVEVKPLDQKSYREFMDLYIPFIQSLPRGEMLVNESDFDFYNPYYKRRYGIFIRDSKTNELMAASVVTEDNDHEYMTIGYVATPKKHRRHHLGLRIVKEAFDLARKFGYPFISYGTDKNLFGYRSDLSLFRWKQGLHFQPYKLDSHGYEATRVLNSRPFLRPTAGFSPNLFYMAQDQLGYRGVLHRPYQVNDRRVRSMATRGGFEVVTPIGVG